jgi:superfamily II DNA or RNA helicase
MKLTLGKEIVLSGASLETRAQFKKELSMPNPAYEEARRHKRWTGKIPKNLHFYEEDQEDLKFARGFMRRTLEIVGKDIPFQDNRQILSSLNLKFLGQLRPYQEKAFQSIIMKDFGVLEALCGAGKTVIALKVIVKRQQPTLIIVHSVELLEQWQDRIKTFLGFAAGLIGNGKYNIQPVTVGIVNSVEKYLPKLLKHFSHIVVDETHKIPCQRMVSVVKEFNCQFILGCSATPYRRDKLTPLIYLYAGPLVHKIDPKELQDIGAVLIPEIQTRETGFNYQKLLSLIVTDEDRNNMIVQDVLFEAKRPGTALVVSDRIEHCVVLHDLLKTMPGSGLKVKILTGQLKSKERTSLVENIRAGKIKVVIATVQLIGEGFDCPGLSSLFLATPIKFSGRLIQVVGRDTNQVQWSADSGGWPDSASGRR